MNETLAKRGPDEEGYYINNHIALAHKRLIVIDPEGSKQPMTEKASYVWNIPLGWKAYKGREKGLLRHICQDFLPAEIVDRKKSPYPKTHNPTYLKKVKQMLSEIMKNKNAHINYLLNRDYILEILETNGNAFSRPWFGQLMTGPQLMAYLCQVNMWLERYQPKLQL